MKNKFLPTLFILVLALSFLPDSSRALTVGPAKIEYQLDPGSTVNGTFFLLNEGSDAQTLSPLFEKFTETNGEKQFQPGAPSDLTNWFAVAQSVVLAPHQSKDIPFTLTVPNNAPPGGHFAVIWWGTAPPNSNGGTGTSIVTRAGILVYLNVSGKIQESARVAQFDAGNGAKFFSWLPTNFNVVFQNTGNVYLKPSGSIRIKNMLGITDAVLSVNKYGAEILPQSKKTLIVAPESVRWGGFGFGLYTAEVALQYGEQNDKQTTAQFSFFVITWQILAPFILGLLFIFWFITRGIKKYNQWVIQKARESKS